MFKKCTLIFVILLVFFVNIVPVSQTLIAEAASTVLFTDTFAGFWDDDVPTRSDGYYSGTSALPSPNVNRSITVQGERLRVFVNSGSNLVFSRNLTQPVTSGKVMVEFDFEVTQIGDYNLALPGLQGSASDTNYVQLMMANGEAKLTPVNYVITANTVYRQKIIADYSPSSDGKYYYDYYIENLTTHVVFSDKKRVASDGFASLPTKDFSKIYFNIQSNSNPQTIYLDNIKVTKVDSLAVNSLTLSDDTVVANNDTGVPADEALKLKFNSPVSDDILSDISISPAVNMQKSVNSTDNTVVDLTFPETMGFGINYTVSVAKNAADTSGVTMNRDFSTSFTTDTGNFLFMESFNFSDGTPLTNGHTDVPIDTGFKLTFNSLIDPATLAGITMVPNVATKQIVLDSANNKIINITFPLGLEYNKNYTITLPVTLKNTLGQGLYVPVSRSFTVESEVYVPDINENTIFFDTYDTWADGFVPSAANKYSVWDANASRSVMVENKRLKITTNGSTDMSFTRLTDIIVNSGKVAVEFEFEFSSIGTNNLAFPAIQSSDTPGDGISFIQPQVVPNITQVGENITLTANTKYKQVIIANYTPVGGRYFYDYFLYNLTNPEAPPIVERKNIQGPDRFINESTNRDFTKVMFRLGTGSTPPQVLYIDNLNVYRIPDLEVKSFTYPGGLAITDNQTDIPVLSQFRANLNTEIDESSLSGITITPNIPMTISADPTNKKILNITFPKGLDYQTSYTVEFPNTVKNIAGNPLSGGYRKTFVTEAEPANIIIVENKGFTDFSGNTITTFPADGKICAEVTVKSNAAVEISEKEFYLILSVKSASGQLLDIAFLNTTIGYNEIQTLSAGFTLLGNTGGMSCDLYMWDGFPGYAYDIKKVLP